MVKINKYYKNTLNAMPHDNVRSFIEIERKTGKAIDLGCGAGRDTIFLIKNNWKVIGIDKENTKEMILENLNDKEKDCFRYFKSEFEDINLESNNLVVANYSIPFCKKTKFPEFWDKIINSIEKERIFCRKLFWNK